jgi:hypothetical protein
MKDAASEAYAALDAFRQGIIGGLYTSALAVVESYSPTGKANISILPDGDLVSSVPVATIQGGGFYVRAPLKKGDIVVVVFSYRSIDGVMHQADDQSPRTHDINDAIIVGGINPFTSPLPAEDGDKLVLSNANGSGKITIAPDGLITIKGRDEIVTY